MKTYQEMSKEELTQELKSITDKISEMDMRDIYVKEFININRIYINYYLNMHKLL